MEDGVKEDPAQCKEMRFLAKAGWLKKAPGRLLASYKERYIHVLKTELVVYENEDLQNCLERLDLENYDQCHELKTPFKKKHRLILIRSARSGNKVHDVKFQAQTAEEKDAWIKVLTDGINRAKNKVFDEVKVDESSNLEHVTRTRPKGNRNRRPPTRIHMKEVAVVSSDGILRLDLDLEDTMPNGAPLDNMEGTETPKEAVKVPTPLPSPSNATEKESGPSAEEGAQTEPEVSPKKKVIKPPMPPTKEAKSSSAPEDEPDKDCPHKKVPDEASTESPGTRKRTGPPPTLPNKPSSSISLSILAEASQASSNSQPPNPPSKEKKPSHPAVDPDLGVQGTAAENEGKDNRKKSPGTAVERDESPSSEVQGPEEELGGSSSPCPPLTPKKNPDAQKAKDSPTVREPRERQEEHTVSPHTASDGSDSSLQEQLTPLSHSINLSPLLCLPAQKKKKAEEKSVDSGQHSDDESEGSGSEDALAASAAALRGGHVGLDLMDASEDNIEISVGLRPIQVTTESQVRSKASHSPHSKPSIPLKASTKAKSASIGDLLADSSICTQSSQHVRAEAGSDTFPADDVMKLETEVALEREKTGELLSRVSQSQSRGDSEGLTEDLLAKALEKLERAELVLREVRKLKLTKNSRDRKSW